MDKIFNLLVDYKINYIKIVVGAVFSLIILVTKFNVWLFPFVALPTTEKIILGAILAIFSGEVLRIVGSSVSDFFVWLIFSKDRLKK